MNWFHAWLVRHIWGFFFVSGLSIFIPWLASINLPTALETLKVASTQVLLLSAIAMTVIGVIGSYATAKNTGQMLKWMGLYTLIPGLLGVAFSAVNKQVVYARAEHLFPAFDQIKPAVDAYLGHTIPKLFMLTIVFSLIGLYLFWKGWQLSRQQQRQAQNLLKR